MPGLVLVLALAGGGVFCAFRFRLESSVATLLPPASQQLATLARRVIDSTASRSMVLSVGPSSSRATDAGTSVPPTLAATARRVVRQMAAELASDPAVAWVRLGPEPGALQSVHSLYFDRRYNFVAATPTELRAALSQAGIEKRIVTLKQKLAGPSGPFVRKLATADPLLLFERQVERIEQTNTGSLSVVDGQFSAADGHAILALGLKRSAFDGPAQKPLLHEIDQLFRKYATTQPLIMERSGFNVFSVDSEERIKSDTSRVAIISVLGLLALFLVLFRTLSSIATLLLPLLAAFIGALSTCLLVFGEIHALTLAFGASLLGVCIDYPVHLMNHQSMCPEDRQGSTSVRRGLVLGALTTVVGMSALAFTDFDVLKQVAVFASAGLTTAVVFTLLALPSFGAAGDVALRRRLAHGLQRALHATTHHPKSIGLVGAAVVFLLLAGFTRVRWATSLEALAPLNPQLRAEDARVRTRIGAPGSNELVIAVGKDDAEALERNEVAYQKLERARSRGTIRGFSSLHPFIWSLPAQRRSFDAARETGVRQRALHALTEQGFNEALFEPFVKEHESLEFDGLTLERLLRSSLATVAERFVVRGEGNTVILSYPEVVKAPLELIRSFADQPGVDFIDQRRLLDEAYQRLRANVGSLMLVAALIMSLVVLVRYRSIRLGLATLLPALVAAPAALGLLAWTGRELNLFHLIAALVVLSMAMDYGIFLTETVTSDSLHSSATGATLLSLVLAAITTCLSFGLLAFSEIPVLAALGQTIAIGIMLALACTPAAWLLHAHLRKPAE